MPTPTLTPIDLSDPAPPVPGERERAAVRTRARQLSRRRRFLQGSGVLAAVVVVALAGVALTGGGSGTTQVAILHVTSSTLDPQSTVHVDLRNDDTTVTGVADASGTVHFDGDIPPGTYRVFVTIDSPPAPPAEGGASIGSARLVYRSVSVSLAAGVNTLDLDTLIPQ